MNEPHPVEPPMPNPNEVEMLLYGLDRTRRTLHWKCGGLDAAGLGRALAPSTLTLGGLLKHLALVEDHYTAVALTGEPMGEPWDGVDASEWPDWEWRSAAHDAPAELYALWDDAVARSRRAVAQLLETGGLDQPTKLTTDDGRPLNLRRVLVDLHEEYARHVGHADLLREAIDGLVGEDAPRTTS
ncbi:MAG TPA: DinB family protein [Acidimicrobiales bacterium]